MIKRNKNAESRHLIVTYNRGFATANCLIYLVFLLVIIFLFFPIINDVWKINWDQDTLINLNIFLITFCAIGLFFSISLSITAWSVNQNQFLQLKNQFLILSWISINFCLIIINTGFFIQQKNKPKQLDFVHREKWWKKLGFYQWSIFDITLVSVFSALVVIGNWFEMNVHFLPYGAGGLNVKYIFVMVISFLHSLASGLAVGLIGSLISLIFLGSAVVSPWSYLLDYLLPTISPCIVALFSFSELGKNKKLDCLNQILMVVISFILIWFWQTLSGYLIWTKLFEPSWGKSGNGLLYSFVFNAISIWVFSYPVTQILTPIIIYRLRALPWKR